MRHLVVAVLMLLAARGAFASGDGIVVPWTIDPYGGLPADQDAFYNGRAGILMGRAPWARLFAAWRMLHGMPVGAEAGKSLALPCCGGPWGSIQPAIKAWLDARSQVPGAPPNQLGYIDVYRDVGNYVSVQTCFQDAFRTAARTLQDRIASYGAADPWVRAWLDAQDTVFAGCSGGDALPPLDPAAPAWLAMDRAYQEAALALYQRRFGKAASGFDAIAADTSSPWRKLAPYLSARAVVSAALPSNDPIVFADARRRLAALEPAEAYGHADMPVLMGALAFRDRPDARRKELALTLTAPALGANVAADFKDSRRLGQSPVGEPAYLDWIAVYGRAPDKPEAAWFDHFDADQVWKTDAEALAHARERWAATADPAWLLAAMEWSAPSAEADDLVTASRKLPVTDPAWLTALYHRVRLTGAPPEARAELDAVLARADLSMTDRNLLTAERTMAAADLTELARLGPRSSPCATASGDAPGCLAGDYGMEYTPVSRPGEVRLGDEAEAVIDRLPINDRGRLLDAATLPAPLALDIALTTWVRAVLLQDFAAADRLAATLRPLLPQMDTEWAAYLNAKPGEDKRFAAWFILAKIPGADVDLMGAYTRPQGTVAEFDGHWHDWLYAPTGAAPVTPGAITADLTCYGMCGPGAFPFRLPPFAAALADKTAAERGRYLPADPKKAGSVWEDVLAYAKAHPNDPRSPEALYWLVRVSRFGTGHNRSSYRAFVLLHDRYKTTDWAKNSKYFYD